MVVPVKIAIWDFTFEEVVIGFFVDSKILYLYSLVSRIFFLSMEVPRFVVALVDAKVRSFLGLVDLVRLFVGVFEHYSNKD